MKSKVILRTFVFRGGNELCHAAESLLKQTYSKFDWYVLDASGNEQNKKLLSKYHDKRIIYVDLSSSHTRKDVLPSTYLEEILENYCDGDYFTVLDADDTYNPDFIEKMVNYMELYNLDVAACGSDFVNAQNGKVHGTRKLEQNLILEEPDDFSQHFPTYYQFMRTVWGKMFKLSCLRQCDYGEKKQIYGNDTLFTMEAFRNSKRVGILAESLHKYYFSSKSVSYHFDDIRILSDCILLDAAFKYLWLKCGMVTMVNEEFLFIVYMNAIQDTLKVILNAEIDLSEKLNGLHEIFNCNRSKQLAARENFGACFLQGSSLQKQRRELFSAVANWMLALTEVPDEQADRFCDVGEFVCAAAEYAEGWIIFQKLRVNLLIRQERVDEAIVRLDELKELLPSDEEMLTYRDKLKQLRDDRL